MDARKALLGLGFAVFTSAASAALISDGTWDGWTQFADDDHFVSPGGGGQAFDAEYLLYKIEGDVLSIGLQTGFDLGDGHQLYGSGNYWAGDLFLSFDGDDSSYEFAADFGFDNSCGYSYLNDQAGCNALGTHDTAGVYAVLTENNDVYGGHTESVPFLMETGELKYAFSETDELNENDWDSAVEEGDLSYWRQVTFSLSALGLSGVEEVDAHWTMSCGNDAVDGHTEVPEPSSLVLLGFGLIGLRALRKRQ